MDKEMETESQTWIKQRRKERLWHIIGQLIFAGIFVVSILISNSILDNSAGFWHKIIAAVLPMLAVTLWAWMIFTRIRKLEEFQRSIAINSCAISFGILLWAVTCYELIAEIFSLPHFPLFLMAPIAVIMWHTLWETLRYRLT